MVVEAKISLDLKESWNEHGYVVIRNLFNKNMMDILLKHYQYLNEKHELRQKRWGEGETYERGGYIVYEALLDVFSLYISELFGKRFLPAFSYTRAYHHNSSLYKHVDRVGCEVAVSMPLFIEKENPWPLNVALDKESKGTPINLNLGDILIYKGNEVYHWREPYQGKEQINLFMFCVLENGPHHELKYDGRERLSLDMEKLLLIESEQSRWNQQYAETITKLETILEKSLVRAQSYN